MNHKSRRRKYLMKILKLKKIGQIAVKYPNLFLSLQNRKTFKKFKTWVSATSESLKLVVSTGLHLTRLGTCETFKK